MRKIKPIWLAIITTGLVGNYASSAINTQIKVTTAVDENGENAAACSLREAIKTNNDMIPFGGCSIGDRYLQNTIDLEDKVYQLDPALGELAVTRNVRIRGFNTNTSDKVDPLSGVRPLKNPPSSTIDAGGKSRIFNTTANDNGLVLNNLVLRNGGNAEIPRGGAILSGGIVSVGNVIFKNNTAKEGGAVYISGLNSTFNATGSGFENNAAEVGAVISMSCMDNLHFSERAVEISQSSFVGNGGASSQSMIEGCGNLGLSLSTSTIARNETKSLAENGAIIRFLNELGNSATASLSFVTAAENKGGPVIGYSNLKTLSLASSVIAFNDSLGCHDFNPAFSTELRGDYNSLQNCTFTVSGTNSNITLANTVTLASELYPLDYYGGITKSYLPADGSQYILNKGPSSGSCPDGVDQRGVARNQYVQCDRGPVERKQLIAIDDPNGKNKEKTNREARVGVLSNDIAPETATDRQVFTDDFIENYDVIPVSGPCVKGDLKMISETNKTPFLYYDSKGKLTPIGSDIKCKYKVVKYLPGTKTVESTSNEALVNIQIVNVAPNAKDDTIRLEQGTAKVTIDVLANDDDAGDGIYGGLYCGRLTGALNESGIPIEDCSKEPGLNIRITEEPEVGYLKAEYQGPCPDNTAAISRTCYGGKITYHPYNTLSPFEDKFSYSVLDKDLEMSNSAVVTIENSAAPEGSTGGSLGWFSLGVLGMMALRRHRRQVKA